MACTNACGAQVLGYSAYFEDGGWYFSATAFALLDEYKYANGDWGREQQPIAAPNGAAGRMRRRAPAHRRKFPTVFEKVQALGRAPSYKQDELFSSGAELKAVVDFIKSTGCALMTRVAIDTHCFDASQIAAVQRLQDRIKRCVRATARS